MKASEANYLSCQHKNIIPDQQYARIIEAIKESASNGFFKTTVTFSSAIDNKVIFRLKTDGYTVITPDSWTIHINW